MRWTYLPKIKRYKDALDLPAKDKKYKDALDLCAIKIIKMRWTYTRCPQRSIQSVLE